MAHEDFQKFYHSKVALGEGCGCAERIIDVHEFNRLSGRARMRDFRVGGSLLRRIWTRLRGNNGKSGRSED